MSRLRVSLLLLPVLLLSGCTLFYPNWGATSLPEDELIPSTESASPTETETPSASPSPSATESPSNSPSPSASESVMRTEAMVEIVMAVVESDFGLLTVIAQVPGVTDASGSCTLTFLADSFEKSYSAAAEQSSDFMQCAPFDIELSKLAPGSYSAVVEYDSEAHSGSSQPYPIEVQ